jgi:micrococcal nuclease
MKNLLLLASLALSQFSIASVDCSPLDDGIHSANVVTVSDGDTATVKLIKTGDLVKVRFYGADTPETEWKGKWPAQPFSEEAKAFTINKLSNQLVTIDFNGEGTYSRCVGEIFLNSESLSLALINEGYAWWYNRYAPDRNDLKQAQENAKENKNGLWADNDPQAPWDFRKQYNK